jgi:hypothetical protein
VVLLPVVLIAGQSMHLFSSEREFMRIFSILILTGFFVGCVTTMPPQSVEELREEVRTGPSMIKMSQHEIVRPFNLAYNAVQINAERCFEVTVNMPSTGDLGPRVQSQRYRAESLLTSETSAETFMQLDKKSNGPMPEGGYFVLLADIEAMSSEKTKLTIYGVLNGYDNAQESIVAWAQGANDDCPRFPNGALDKAFTYHNP